MGTSSGARRSGSVEASSRLLAVSSAATMNPLASTPMCSFANPGLTLSGQTDTPEHSYVGRDSPGRRSDIASRVPKLERARPLHGSRVVPSQGVSALRLGQHQRFPGDDVRPLEGSGRRRGRKPDQGLRIAVLCDQVRGELPRAGNVAKQALVEPSLPRAEGQFPDHGRCKSLSNVVEREAAFQA